MIIFGFRSSVKLLATLFLVCGHCHNPAAQRIVEVTRKFTLFFIPLFPVAKTRHLTCTYCGKSSRLSKERVTQLIADAQQAPVNGAQAQPQVGPAAV